MNDTTDVSSFRAFFDDIEEDVAPETLHESGKGGGSSGERARIEAVHASVVGNGAIFQGPFGPKHLLYADWAASGRAIEPMEDYIREEVLPLYGNTHTTTSVTGLQSTCFRLEARQAVAQACNARTCYSDKNSDVVLFTGTGSTGAVNHLVKVLGLNTPLPPGASQWDRPVVFVGPYEHHSNLLPWRESCALVVQIPEDPCGKVDLVALQRELVAHARHTLKIGTFCAASNVTGVVAEVEVITEVLHRHGALAMWDYASAAPHLPIDMNPVRIDQATGAANPWVSKDAVFVSPHKLPGGVGAPGLLIAKKALFRNPVPAAPGGGTVFFVTEHDHRYLSNREEREEGGTQDVIGGIRLGLAFQLKSSVGDETIRSADVALTQRLYRGMQSHPNVVVMGPPHEEHSSTRRIPIVSFLIRAPEMEGKSRFLHYNFVATLLNDLFGIQARGGCLCAGPYGLSLLGITLGDAHAIEAGLLDKMELMRPGFVRLSLPYFATKEEVDYVLAAVAEIADMGWRLLPLYRCNPKTGEWKHHLEMRSFPARKWLAHAPFLRNLRSNAPQLPVPGGPSAAGPVQVQDWAKVWDRQLAEAREVMAGLGSACSDQLAASDPAQMLRGQEHAGVSLEELRWFVFPAEASALLRAHLPRNSPAVGLAATPPARGTHTFGAVQPKTYASAQIDRDPLHSRPSLKAECTLTEPATSTTPLMKAATAATGSLSPMDSAGGTAPPVAEDAFGEVAGPGRGSLSKADKAAPARGASKKHPLRGGRQPQQLDPRYGGTEPPASDLNTDTADTIGGALNHDNKESAADSLSTDTQDTSAFSFEIPGGSDSDADVQIDASQGVVGGAPGPSRGVRGKFARPPQKLMKAIMHAVSEWGMIQQGDRICLGLSGGKDSLALLHCLVELQKRFPPGTFTLAAATVDPGTEAFNPRPLIPYMESLGVPYHYLATPIMDMAAAGHMKGDSICAFCSRMKRGALYTCCRENGYNVLVLAQHLDDLAESFIMSAFFNGKLRTMKASYTIDAGDIRLIRPLLYAREKLLRDFAYESGMPVIDENCPACFEAPKERYHLKKMLAKEENMNPNLYPNLRQAMVPLMDQAALDVLSSLREEVAQQTVTGRRAKYQRSRKPRAGMSKPDLQNNASQVVSEEKSKSYQEAPTDVKGLTSEQQRVLDSIDDRMLLQELVRRRRQSRHWGKDSTQTQIAGDTTGGVCEAVSEKVAPADEARGDAEFEQELSYAQDNCTAAGCVLPSKGVHANA